MGYSTSIGVSTAPVLLFTPQAAAQSVTITNTGTSTVFLGQTGVTAALGFPLAAGQSINLPQVNCNLYGVSAPETTKSPTSTLSAGVSAAGTALTVASGGTSFTTGMQVVIVDGNSTEVVTIGAGATATNIPCSALAFSHLTGVAFGQLNTSRNAAVKVSSGA